MYHCAGESCTAGIYRIKKSMEGWICLHRKFLQWEWAGDANMVALFIYLLLMANTDDGYKWKGIALDRGQLLTGRKELSKKTGLSEQTVRTCLKRLESTNEITIKSTNKYSIITICNYRTYQDKQENNNQQFNRQSNKQPTNNQPTTNHIQQYNNITTNKNNNISTDLETFFEDFRKAYKGNKRGFKAEFENLQKKRQKDWQEVIPKLLPALERMEQWREQTKQAKKFVPDYAMLQTWINQNRWEMEYETINDNGNYMQESSSERTRREKEERDREFASHIARKMGIGDIK
jgi:predicted transcriptional regulator